MTHPQRPSFQLTYLVGELLMLAWAASVQRAKPYSSTTTAKNRPSTSRFRQELVAFAASDLLPHYFTGCTEEKHVEHLLRLSEYGTRIGGALFGDTGYRLGIAQKFFNLFLKSLWSLGLIPEPPHCPVDRIIIARACGGTNIKWTEMTTVDEYERAISALQTEAASHQLSLAEWELRHYDRRNPLTLDLERLIDGRNDNATEGEIALER